MTLFSLFTFQLLRMQPFCFNTFNWIYYLTKQTGWSVLWAATSWLVRWSLQCCRFSHGRQCLPSLGRQILTFKKLNQTYLIKWSLFINFLCWPCKYYIDLFVYTVPLIQTLYWQKRAQKVTKPEVNKGQLKLLHGSGLVDTPVLDKITPCQLQHMHVKYWIKNVPGGHRHLYLHNGCYTRRRTKSQPIRAS